MYTDPTLKHCERNDFVIFRRISFVMFAGNQASNSTGVHPVSKTQFIGLDVGRSATKVCALTGGERIALSFPTAVMHVPDAIIPNDVAALAKPDTVTVEGRELWVGPTALAQQMQAEALGRRDEWVLEIEHFALLASAVARLQAAGLQYDPSKAVITLGVPSRVAAQRLDLVVDLRKRAAELLAAGGAKPIVQILPQPLGIIGAHTLTEEGAAIEGHDPDTARYAVIEVGQYTTDFSAVRDGGTVVGATVSTDGVELVARRAAEDLAAKGLRLYPRDLSEIMVNTRVRRRGVDVELRPTLERAVKELLLPKIASAAKAAFGPQLLEEADAVLVAGGGAYWVFEALQALPDFAHAKLVPSPREAVAEGFARLSAMVGAASGGDR